MLDRGDQPGDDLAGDGHGLGARHPQGDAVVIERPQDDLVVQREFRLGVPDGTDGRGEGIGILARPETLIHLFEHAGPGADSAEIITNANHRAFVFVVAWYARREALRSL